MTNEILLPRFSLPPSVNDAYATIIQGRGQRAYPQRILTKAAANYKMEVSAIMNESGFTTRLRDFVEFHVTVEVWAYIYRSNWYTKKHLVNRNAGDADNRIKLLQDTLFNCIGVDDAFVFFTGVRKMPLDEGKEPFVLVRVRKTIDEVDQLA